MIISFCKAVIVRALALGCLMIWDRKKGKHSILGDQANYQTLMSLTLATASES